ncbi:uncharacterized protein LOC143570023 [Bidens hawaiensis]|uniref:uncharacterized protein LOC143570023 n=1 Tax=Bidens hawaiensis TaxID=980011 RepID=UPI00404AC86F
MDTPPPLFVPYIPKDCAVDAVDQLCLEREKSIKQLQQALNVTQNRMKQLADSKRTEREFTIGQWVYLKLQSYRQISLKDKKLSPKYFGPFLIIEKIGKVAYKLDLPAEAQLLKLARGDHSTIFPLPAQPRFMFYPTAIVERKMVKRGNRVSIDVLVRWKDLPVTEATWESVEAMKARFPDFNFDL